MLKIVSKLFIGGDWNVCIQENEKIFLITPKKGFWYADPFLFEFDNKIYLFVEAFEKKKELGRIGFLSSDDNFSNLNIIVSNQFHYSFPNVFSHKKDIYMIPESSEEHGVFLYKFNPFPSSPVRISKILKGEYVDTSLVKKEGDSYIFASYDNKFKRIVFFQYDFINGLTQIINSYDDIEKNLRPAGNAFTINNKLVIPFQYCKNKYGEKIVLKGISFGDNKVIIDGDIEEINIGKFNFIKKHGRIHTYNTCDNLSVVDYMNERFSLFKSFHMLRRKRRRIIHAKGKKDE